MKILSLCGGGTSGYMTACLLGKIETELQIRIKEQFDIVGGVSTGSIIGTMLDIYDVETIKESYTELQSYVFGRKRNIFLSMFMPMYDLGKLYGAANKLFDGKQLGHISNFKFLTYALELNGDVLAPKFFKSWENNTTYIKDAITASSCVPGAFKPFNIGDKLYFDGGVIRNNPTMPLVADVISQGTPLEDVKCLTLETDYHRGFSNAKNLKGLFNISKNFSMLSIDGGERVSSYISDKILGDNLVDVIPDVYLPVESNDWKTMEHIADTTWKINKDRIIKLIES